MAIGTLSFELMGGRLPSPQPSSPDGQQIIVQTPTPDPSGGKKNLQLYTFFGSTPTPPAKPLQKGNVCANDKFNEEPDIFRGSDPPAGGIVTAGGQIKVWIDDGNGGSMAPGEKVDPNTGQITTPGDRSASDGKGPNYYLWEPAIYLTKLNSSDQPGPFSGDAENGGTPYFPVAIKGKISYADQGNDTGFLKGYRQVILLPT